MPDGIRRRGYLSGQGAQDHAGLNAAFVNIGHEKDAFIHYLDLGSQFSSLQKLVASYQPGKRGIRLDAMKLEPPIEKSGKIGSYLQVGQTVMVQVAKEAISTKGPRLTADISLAGRNVVLVPFSSKVFLSQKIRSAEEKKRLKGIAAAVLPKNFGVIIRTALSRPRTAISNRISAPCWTNGRRPCKIFARIPLRLS